jgi:hypothetical protein
MIAIPIQTPTVKFSIAGIVVKLDAGGCCDIIISVTLRHASEPFETRVNVRSADCPFENRFVHSTEPGPFLWTNKAGWRATACVLICDRMPRASTTRGFATIFA